MDKIALRTQWARYRTTLRWWWRIGCFGCVGALQLIFLVGLPIGICFRNLMFGPNVFGLLWLARRSQCVSIMWRPYNANYIPLQLFPFCDVCATSERSKWECGKKRATANKTGFPLTGIYANDISSPTVWLLSSAFAYAYLTHILHSMSNLYSGASNDF